MDGWLIFTHLGAQVSSFGFGFRGSGFRFQVSAFGLRGVGVGFGSRVSGVRHDAKYHEVEEGEVFFETEAQEHPAREQRVLPCSANMAQIRQSRHI